MVNNESSEFKTPSTKPRLVVIGNGMAGMRAVEELLARAPGLYDITVFGAEPEVNYNRILLSPVLSGEKKFDDIVINTREWYADNGITLYTGEAVIGIDRGVRTVVSDSGRRIGYDKLLLATGSEPFIIPVPGTKLPGVTTFRDMADVNAMLAMAKPGRRAVVIGGGLLGLEAASGLKVQGMEVTVVHLADFVMERQLDRAAAELLKADLDARGIEIVVGANTSSIEGTNHVEAVQLADGRRLSADLVVIAVGIRPNATMAKASGIVCERGIVVDDCMMTSDPDILAVGECVQHRGMTYGLVAPLFEMAKVVGAQLAGNNGDAYAGSVISTRLKVTGIDVFSAGNFAGGEGCEEIVFRDGSRGVYKRLVLQDNRIKGAVLYGDAREGPWYFQLLKDGVDVSTFREALVFGQAFAEGGYVTDSGGGAFKLADQAEICGCNGVCKGTIVSAIAEKGLKTVDEVRAHTKASSSCGSCTGLVEQLLAATAGDAYQSTPKVKPMCPCTPHPHDEVRARIVADGLKTIPQVMEALGWTTPNGCSSCRPALNYYLICAWPGEYRDDHQSRFINERAHANIQKDGTYSVVPRMWGGVTTANELRAIADVVDRFDIPTVKVTGGQRIDLLGVKKEQLPAVWSELNQAGLVSGHAYGKALRTVKTCVGSEWCRFGTQDSTAMGIALEKMTWGSWMPHKFKMGVSGCPRNCAESTIKDFGVIAVDSGWELYIGGNGGIKVRVTDHLCKVTTADEVLEYCGAFTQFYRESARYLERTAPWVERIGLEAVKKRVVDDAEGRKQLYERFLHSQRFFQKDPWAERAHGVQANEFRNLAKVG
jgi:nitrite reductase (NADH) large subunit